ncbi:MAG TPA: YggT family protein [Nocardioidaceae bacterium]|nr:YggT family protein [Nocardioidaceae bacterium]
MEQIGAFINFVLYLYIGLLLARLVVEWVQAFARSWSPRGPLLVILEVVYTLTDPPINFVRRFVPPIRLGGIAIDVAFIIVLIFVYVLRALNAAIFFSN